MRKYFIPGCVGRGLDLDLRIRPAPAASGNPSGWAQAGPKWVGPSRAQVGGPKPEIWSPTKIKKIKILKIQIHSAQNIGKIWISRGKIILATFGSISSNFFLGLENARNRLFLSIFLGPMAAIFLDGPVSSPCCYPPLVGK